MALKSKKVGNYTVKVNYDEVANSPREYDDLSTIYSNHRRINPDNHSIDELLDDEHNLKIEGLVALKVWLFEHGTYAFKITELDEGNPFGNGMYAQFDSGVFGVIAIPIEAAKKVWGGDDWEEKAKHCMKCAIDEYDKYVNGEVFYYYIENNNGELVDSCGGYYDMEEAMNDAIETAKDYNEADEQEAKDFLENGTLEQLKSKFYELATEAPIWVDEVFELVEEEKAKDWLRGKLREFFEDDGWREI